MNPLLAGSWKGLSPEWIGDGAVDVLIGEMPPQERAFVVETLQIIDSLCGVQVRLTSEPTAADLVVDDVASLGREEVQGLASWKGSQVHANWLSREMLYATVVTPQPPLRERYRRKGRWRTRLVKQPPLVEKQLGPWAKHLITHELLHGFGLNHPQGNGFSPAFSFATTQMSYRPDPAFSWSITPLDADALVAIWGPA
jgi:hypothetical protein